MKLREQDHLAWPFFDDVHRALAADLRDWAGRELDPLAHAGADVEDTCRALVRQLGDADWLRFCVPSSHGGAFSKLDVRALCLCRETLAQHEPLADFAFAMQGLGAGPISLFGSAELKDRYLPGVRDGSAIAAFALSEAQGGSDIAAMRTTAEPVGGDWVLNGEKTFISNAGIASHYVVFARTPSAGPKAYGAFVVDAGMRGVGLTEKIDTIAPHPLGTIILHDVAVPGANAIGERGKGLRVALGTLDVFRSTVAAAALGFARRALREALEFAATRRAFGKALSDHQMTQAKVADMALRVDASALLVYRAAWTRDVAADRVTREAAMAKLFATESAQRVIDDAVQILGGRGVVSGATVERLYREIRALRIYEGTSEIQKLVIAGDLLGE